MKPAASVASPLSCSSRSASATERDSCGHRGSLRECGAPRGSCAAADGGGGGAPEVRCGGGGALSAANPWGSAHLELLPDLESCRAQHLHVALERCGQVGSMLAQAGMAWTVGTWAVQHRPRLASIQSSKQAPINSQALRRGRHVLCTKRRRCPPRASSPTGSNVRELLATENSDLMAKYWIPRPCFQQAASQYCSSCQA